MLLVLLSLLFFVEITKGYKNSVLLVIFERFWKKKKYIPSVSIICDVILVEPFYVKQTNKKASKVPADNIPIQLRVCEICCISLGGHTWQLLGLPRAMKK